MPRIELSFKILGAILVAGALIVNPFSVGSILGKSVDSLPVLFIFFAFEFLLALAGGLLYFKRGWFSHHWRELLLLFLASFFSLIVLEIGLQLFYQPPPAGWYGYPPGLYIPDDVTGSKYRPGFKGYFPNAPYNKIEIAINSKGLRDLEHDYQKPAGVTRILGLGDSVTFGSGVSFEDTYLRQLEKKLGEAGYKIEVVKTGVNGYDFDQEYAYYLNEGYRYDPDLVILGIVLNDIRPVTAQMIREHKEYQEQLLKAGDKKSTTKATLSQHVSRYCRLCGLALAVLENWESKVQRQEYNLEYFNHSLTREWRTNYSRYEEKILQLFFQLSNENRKLVLVIFPYLEQLKHSYGLTRMPQDLILETAKTNNIMVVDLMPYLDRLDYKDLFLGGDSMHLNSDGYAIVAQALYDELVKRAIIRK
ncbi:MAG: SGNH/GDSL hydrolase family protein [Parcubacteria group bacterium]|nr:SGNH/GDSL hydrolase family protein [Parcubacteria group bacterium]